MGYIKKAVHAGVEFADNYEIPGYIAKARENSTIINVASEKIENFYCEKGSPLLQMVDDLTAAKIQTALAVANNKVEQAQTLKTAAAAKVHKKTNEAIEMAKQTKVDGIAKYETLKLLSSKKVDETKTIMRKRVVYASEEVEKKLKEKASTNEYANKVLSLFMKTKEQVQMYSVSLSTYSETLVKKSMSMGLFVFDDVKTKAALYRANTRTKMCELSSMYAAKRSELLSFVSVSYTKMSSKTALTVFRNVFGEKAALYAEEKMLEFKKANVYDKVNDKMTTAYTFSAVKVGKFAETAHEMEEKYVGTSLVARARRAVMGGK